MQELFAFMRVRSPTAATGFDAKKMRLHHRLAPGQKLDAHAGSGLQNFSLAGPDKPRIFRGGFKQRQNICAIEPRDAAQRGDGGAHLAAFERAEEANGILGGLRPLCEGQSAANTQPTEALAGKGSALY